MLEPKTLLSSCNSFFVGFPKYALATSLSGSFLLIDAFAEFNNVIVFSFTPAGILDSLIFGSSFPKS